MFDDSFGSDNESEIEAENQETANNEDDNNVKESIQEFLEKVVLKNPEVDFLDLSEQNIQSIEEVASYLVCLKKLKDLNLGKNPLSTLPSDLSQIIPDVQTLNLNGVDFSH
jgi:hypothetical protein